HDAGWSAAIKSLYYDDRPWKPVILGAITFPFAVIFSGSVHLATAALMALFYGVLLTYTCLMLLEFASPWFAAAGTLFIGTVPFVINFAIFYGLYLPGFACLFAASYH